MRTVLLVPFALAAFTAFAQNDAKQQEALADQLEAAQAAAEASASRPGDESLSCDALQAEIVAMLGQSDSAMAILRGMYEDGDPNLRQAGIQPLLAPLHDDPRFVALLEKIGLAPVPAARAWMEDR